MFKQGFVFIDVECNGFNGETFATALLVTDNDGKTIKEVTYYCDYNLAKGEKDWIKENCYPTFSNNPHMNTQLKLETLEEFNEVTRANILSLLPDYIFVADCPCPCETNFFRQINITEPPYPFIDVASMLLARRFNPLGVYERKEDELPYHHPMSDVYQTKRLFFHILFNECYRIREV